MSGRRGGFVFRFRLLLPSIVFDAPMFDMNKMVFKAQSSSGGLKVSSDRQCSAPPSLMSIPCAPRRFGWIEDGLRAEGIGKDRDI